MNRGLIKLLIVLIIAIILLGYFHVDVRQIVTSVGAQANVQYVWGLLKTGWANYLWPFLTNLWHLIAELIQKLRQ